MLGSLKPFAYWKPLKGTLANSEDSDEMPHDAAFHQGRHCLLRLTHSSEKEIQIKLEIITCDPPVYAINHPKFIVSYQVKEPIRIQRVKRGEAQVGGMYAWRPT